MTYEELDSLKDDSRLSSIEKENINYVLKYWVDIITNNCVSSFKRG